MKMQWGITFMRVYGHEIDIMPGRDMNTRKPPWAAWVW